MCTSSASSAPGTQPRVGADAAAGADVGVLEVRERRDLRAGADGHVLQHAMRADRDVVAQRHRALEHAADVDAHVAAAGRACRGCRCAPDRRSRCPRAAASPPRALDDALDRGELRAIVDAENVALVGGEMALDGNALGHRHGDDVGEVELALRVVGLERADPATRAVPSAPPARRCRSRSTARSAGDASRSSTIART